MAQVVWFKKSAGLATRFDSVRIPYEKGNGVKYLAEAYNVDFDFTGAIFRRKGFEASNISGACHSFFWGGGDCYFYKDGSLCMLGSDLTATAVASGISNRRLSYCQVGDAIIYMNGSQNGVLKNGQRFAYVKPPDEHTPDGTRIYNDPPVGSIVRSFAGRIWVADGNTLWYSEPFGPNLFRLSVNYIQLPAKITMVAPVQGGLFVSTTNKIYFFAGTVPREFVQHIVAHYPAIPFTDVEVDGIAVSAGQFTPLPAQMFTTTQGICMGTADGKIVNLTYDTLLYPSAPKGCAVYTGDKYIVSLDGQTENLSLCMSLGIIAPSQYANYNFDGMCKFNGIVVGGNSSGVFTLASGDNDAGTLIPAHFRTGATDFGAENEKSLRKLYMSLRCTGRMEASISADGKEDVVREITPYDNKLKIIHQQIQGGRDIKGKYLDLKMSNVRGSDFTITEIQALLIVKGSKTTEVLS